MRVKSLFSIFFLLFVLPMYSCAQSVNNQDCAAWVSELHSKIIQSPSKDRLATIFRSIGESTCDVIPKSIREVAMNSGKLSKDKRSAVLGEAVKAYLPSKCEIVDYNDNSIKIAKNCPLLQSENISESLYRLLDAGSYAYIWVLQQVLIKEKINQSKSKTDMGRVINYMLISVASANE